MAPPSVASGGILVSVGVSVSGYGAHRARSRRERGNGMACSVWEALSAIGTLAAVAVALWFSVQSMRATGRVEKDRAQLVAARMLSPISALERKASSLFGWFCFNDGEAADQQVKTLLDLKELDVMAKAISVEDLYPLLHLESHAAKRAARALGLIQTFSGEAIAMLAHRSWANVALREPYFKRWRAMLSEIKDHLAVAVSACEAAASTGAPRPTAEEIHGY